MLGWGVVRDGGGSIEFEGAGLGMGGVVLDGGLWCIGSGGRHMVGTI